MLSKYHALHALLYPTTPMTPQLLVKLSKVVNYKDQVEVVAWTGLLLGFYMFLRKSNLVPDTMDSFNAEQQLCRKDINLLGLDKAMMIEIRWSKTIQFKQKGASAACQKQSYLPSVLGTLHHTQNTSRT